MPARFPIGLRDLGACLTAAATLVDASAAEAATATKDAGRAGAGGTLEEALGFGTRGARPRQAQAALKDLEDQQKARAKRLQRDALDRALTELTGFYRDVLSVQTGSGVGLVNEELRASVNSLAARSTPESTLHRIDALLACRTALEGNVAPLLAVEATMVALAAG